MSERLARLEDFVAERERWEALYRADPQAQLFVSWAWLRAYFAQARHGWTVLVLRERDALVAALPVKIRAVPAAALPVARELAFAADPLADYQSMLCVPGREAAAIASFAAALAALPWDRASFRDVADARLLELIARLRSDGAEPVVVGQTPCRRATLPRDWETYARSLGSRTRSNTVGSIRKLHEAFPQFRITEPREGDIDEHVEAMLAVNHLRWGGSMRSARRTYGALYRAAFELGILRLQIAWDGARPIAGCVSFVDPARRTYSLYKVGYDGAYAKYSPGRGMLGVAIRDAIESGYTVFDFLRGDEPYKASYAGEVVITTHHRIVRPSVRSRVLAAVQPAYQAVKATAARVVYGPGRTV